MRARSLLLLPLILIAVGGAGFYGLAWQPGIAAIDPPPRAAFDPALIERGARLAGIGNCAVCHTAPGGATLAGGLPIATPFGAIHSTNITPDPDTGIGRWPEAAFLRAMRRGVDREGRHLYPAFPYDHFTLVTDEDDRALYAFLMTRTPVRAEAPRNDLRFPFNFRPILAGWKLLFLHAGAYQPNPTRGDEWNRGAYLVKGLGHCGACHTPRNALGAEIRTDALGGGEAEGWSAYALDARSPAPLPWSGDKLYAFLRQGWQEEHGIARGPMAGVTASLAGVPDADISAMAAYIADRMGPPTFEKKMRADRLLAAKGTRKGLARPAALDSPDLPGGLRHQDHPGQALYAAACAACHDRGVGPPFGGLDLHLSTGISGPTPDNVINVVLGGLPAAPRARGAVMPGFDGVIDDRQLADLLVYLRARFSDQPAWPDPAPLIADKRRHPAGVTPGGITGGGTAASRVAVGATATGRLAAGSLDPAGKATP